MFGKSSPLAIRRHLGELDHQNVFRANQLRTQDHCIDHLRQSIMCAGDMTPMLVIAAQEKEHVDTADYSTRHRCRNFDKLLSWTLENAVAAPPVIQ
jgi:hypothetical protein